MQEKNKSPNLFGLLKIWLRLSNLASMPKNKIVIVAGTATLAAFSEFFTVALIQPVILLFSGSAVEGGSLFFLQDNLISLLEQMDSKGRIISILCLLIFLQILREFFLFLAEFFSIKIRTRFEYNIRKKTYDKCLKIPIHQYLSTSSGDMHSIVNSYPRSSAGFVFSVISMLPTTIMLTVYVAMMVKIEWRLFALVSAISFLILLAMRIAYAKQTKYGIAMREGLVAASTKANELIHALPVIRSFAQEAKSLSSYLAIATDFLAANAKSAYLNSALGPMQRIISFVLILGAIIIYYSFSPVDEKEFLSTLILFMFILTRINGPLTALNMQRAGLSQLYPTIRDLLSFLESPEERQGGVKPTSLEKIEFKDVGFTYRSGIPAISGIDLSISKGEFIGIVGPSGAGKTTLINLISSFELPTSGELQVNGQNLNLYDLKAWRKMLSIVPQKPYMFDMSIKHNIKYGVPNATEEDTTEAIRLANVSSFIGQLPHGFDSMAGEGGNRLSGGQVQRLAIARAIITKPDILILDEATSAQDTNSESKIKETIENLRGEMAFVVIAHRLSTIVNADKIIVLDKGKIVETGTHAELIKIGGLYNHLYTLSIQDDKNNRSIPLEI